MGKAAIGIQFDCNASMKRSKIVISKIFFNS